ncbi:hypothetical protein AB0M05_28840 [Streptomyces violaceusniger]|uniref:hypothetical protein n=1 Tax=Streptomyces violaceusniger TaxID=68280 RepID=UPI0034448126
MTGDTAPGLPHNQHQTSAGGADVAHAFDQWGKPDRCYRALLAAEHAAPQEVRRGSVRTMAAGLMRHDRALPGVRAFAQRVDALV